MKRPGDRLLAILSDAARLSDDELRELHRVLSITVERLDRPSDEQRRRHLELVQRRDPALIGTRVTRSSADAWREKLRALQ